MVSTLRSQEPDIYTTGSFVVGPNRTPDNGSAGVPWVHFQYTVIAGKSGVDRVARNNSSKNFVTGLDKGVPAYWPSMAFE